MFLAGLVVLGLSLMPWAIATTYPPAGTAFLGTFYYVDDFFNYLSYAQQAEGGAFLFTNKAVLADHAPALVNLEWWLVGELSRLMGGGHLLLAYRLIGVLAASAFLLVANRWLDRLGLGEGDRLPALLLVALGGGMGGFIFKEGLGPVVLQFAGRGLTECLDLFTGFFPFVGFLTNPHFTAGTTLLLLGLLLYDTAEGLWGLALATLVATALALVRPYDFVMLVLVRGMAVLLLEPARVWAARLSPLFALLPVTAYLYWLFYRNPAFAFYSGTSYVFPPLTDFLWALGPAALLALFGALAGAPDQKGRRARVHLALWAALAGIVIAARPVGFSLQFLVGMGFPLLALGALGLARLKPVVTLVATGVFATTFAVALHFMLTARPFWLTGRDTMAVVEKLRGDCRKGDILFAPPDVGLFAYGLTPCRSFLSHRISPGYDQRFREWEGFMGAPPAERRALLDAYRVRHLVLPGDPGAGVAAWLGPDSGWTQASVFGSPARLSLYTRP